MNKSFFMAMAAVMLALPAFAQKELPVRHSGANLQQHTLGISRLGDVARASQPSSSSRPSLPLTTSQSEAEDVIYKQDFNDPLLGISQMTVIDANADEATWDWYGNRARCSYHRTNKADDWLITPSITLEAGRQYSFSIKAQSYSERYGERFEVKLGNAATAEAMTITLVEPTDIKSETKREFTNLHVIVPADGMYYIGVHGISDADCMYLYVDDITLWGGASTSTPAAVQNFCVTADPAGALSATVAFTAPVVQIDGSAQTADMNIRLSRDGEEVKAWSGVAPGTALQCVDSGVPYSGEHTYSVVAAAGEQDGEVATLVVYVGLDVPAAIQNLCVADLGTGIDFRFDPFSPVGLHGGVVVPEEVSVDLLDVYVNELSGGLVLGDVLGSTQSNHIGLSGNTNLGPQGVEYWALRPWNLEGDGPVEWVPVFLGQPTPLPYFENFKGRKFNNYWTYDVSTSSVVLNWGYESSDDDGTSILFNSVSSGEWGFIESGKVDISRAAQPTLSLDVKGAEGNHITIFVIAADGKYVQVAQLPLTDEYVTHTIDLGQFAGSDFVRMRIQSDFETPGSVLMDNICLLNLLEHNLAVSDLQVENEPVRGEECTVLVSVINYGAQLAEGYTIDLLVNDRKVAETVHTTPLDHMKSITEVLAFTPTIFHSGDITIRAVVNYDQDMDDSDNSDEVLKYIRCSLADQPEGFEVSNGIGCLNLCWNQASDEPKVVTEDFESYTPWDIVKDEPYSTTSLGSWTLYNGDQSYAGYLWESVNLPCEFQSFAFVVTNLRGVFEEDFNSYPGHSGDQYLSSFYGFDLESFDMETGDMDYAEQNDWLISPELSGNEQNISFWYQAPSPGGLSAEYVYIQVSQTDNNPSSFTPLNEDLIDLRTSEEDIDWCEYTITLPAGTKYFAINRNDGPDDGLWLMLDDITFEKRTIVPVSYRIYVDQQLVATVDAATCLWQYVGSLDAPHEFSITAVYADGSESEPVSRFYDPAGIEAVTTDADAAQAEYFTPAGLRTDRAHRGISIVRNGDGTVSKQIVMQAK